MRKWNISSKRLSVGTADLRLLGKLKDVLTLGTSGNLIFHRTHIPLVGLASRSCENQVAATEEFLVSEHRQA